jgi:vancomycin resistance protein YoaR
VNDFPVVIAQYACPIHTAPAQRHLAANKIHNIRLGAQQCEKDPLEPQTPFSFWERIGPPTQANGFLEGATFINRQLTSSMGGGLCQLSGLLYNLALLASLQIIERHPHSIDAYGENRYVPLGRDATVAHGQKDLRFRNPHSFPLTFHFEITEDRVSGQVRAPTQLSHQVDIEVSSPRLTPSPLHEVTELSPGSPTVLEGFSGKEVDSWRWTLWPNGRREKEFLFHDVYHATPTRVYRKPASQ